MATLTGTTLGKYQILERLGRGGMADVYRAHHTRLDRNVAIKVLHPHLIEGQDFLARFEREAKAVASLKHPRVVQVFDFDSQDDLHYLVMELIDGGSLRGRLEELAKSGAHLSWDDTLRIFGHVASALDYAHRRGMLHRDVKPANVLLDRDGDAFLSDFGIARILSQTQFTTTGALIGTPHYMSPEQGKGEPLTEAADLYSLGVVLYEILTGRLPYDADTPLGVIHKHLFEPLPSPRSVRADLPAGVDGLMGKAMAKEPGDRLASGEAMLHALENVLAPQPAAAPRPASHEREPGAAPKVGSEPPQAAAPVKPAPEKLTLTSMPTMAMEEQPAEPPLAAHGPAKVPPAALKKAHRLWPIVIGVAAVVVIGAALAIILPRVPSAGSTPTVSAAASPTQAATRTPQVASATAGPSECLTLADCIAQAASARESGRYEDAIEAYTRARSVVPADRFPAYAFLWCDMASTYLVLGQEEPALVNLRTCITRTEGSPTTGELRTRAQTAILSILGGAFAERSAVYWPGPNASAQCSDPANALGPPDFKADDPGSYLCLGVQGFVELEFVYNLPVDGPGADIQVHGDPGRDDTWHVDVSADGDTWLHFGPQSEVVALDLAEVGLARMRFIRLSDTGRGNNGPELDAVEALNSEPAG